MSLAGAGRPGAVDLTAMFQRSERCDRSPEELVYPV
jgi:hypothetical protein